MILLSLIINVLSLIDQKRKHNSPSTPNKPVIRPEVDQKYPQISFSKKLKVAFKELDDENPRNSGEK